MLQSSTVAGATEATPQQGADFWNTIFKGASPDGVAPLNASRTDARMIGNVRVWDVAAQENDEDAPLLLTIGCAAGERRKPGVGGRGTRADRWLRANAGRFGFRNLRSEFWPYDRVG